MIAKFSHTPRAVAYLCDALAGIPFTGPLELTAIIGGGYFLGKREVGQDHLLEVLMQECRHFPEATVVLGESPNGQRYFAIQCRCQTEIRRTCPHHCLHSSSRPLLLVLTEHGPELSRHHILDAINREVHNDLKAERHRSDAGENAQLHVDSEAQRAKHEVDYERWLHRH